MRVAVVQGQRHLAILVLAEVVAVFPDGAVRLVATLRVARTRLDRRDHRVVEEVIAHIQLGRLGLVLVDVRIHAHLGQGHLVAIGEVAVEADIGDVEVLQLVAGREIVGHRRSGGAHSVERQRPRHRVGHVALGARHAHVADDGPGAGRPLRVQAAGQHAGDGAVVIVGGLDGVVRVAVAGNGAAGHLAIRLDGGVGDGAVGQRLHAEAAAEVGGIEMRVEAVRLQRERIAGLPHRHAHEAVATCRAAVLLHLETFAGVVVDAVAVDILGAVVGQAVELVGHVRLVHLRHAQAQAQRVVEELALERRAGAVAARVGTVGFIATVVVAAAQVEHGRILLRILQRVGRLHFHRAGHAAFDQRRLGRLVYRRLADHLRRVLVELDHPAAAGGALLAAVQGGFHETAGHAADIDRAGLAVDALGRDAGQAGQCIGDGNVGQAADVRRRHHVHHGVGVALHVDRGLDAAAEAGHRDRAHVLDVLVFLRLRFGLGGGYVTGRGRLRCLVVAVVRLRRSVAARCSAKADGCQCQGKYVSLEYHGAPSPVSMIGCAYR